MFPDIRLGCTAALFLRLLDNRHFGVVFRDDSLRRHLRAQETVHQIGELIERGMQFGQARAIDAFNNENCVTGVVGEFGALAIAPIEATAYSAFFVVVTQFAGKGGGRFPLLQ